MGRVLARALAEVCANKNALPSKPLKFISVNYNFPRRRPLVRLCRVDATIRGQILELGGVMIRLAPGAAAPDWPPLPALLSLHDQLIPFMVDCQGRDLPRDLPPRWRTGGGSSVFSDTRVGWTAGGGAEWMFMPSWSAKVERLLAKRLWNAFGAVDSCFSKSRREVRKWRNNVKRPIPCSEVAPNAGGGLERARRAPSFDSILPKNV